MLALTEGLKVGADILFQVPNQLLLTGKILGKVEWFSLITKAKQLILRMPNLIQDTKLCLVIRFVSYRGYKAL